MILTYDSILGIPTVQKGETYNEKTSNSNGASIGIPNVLVFVGVLVLFVILFSNLGKKGEEVVTSEGSNGNGSSKLLTIILAGVLIVVVLLNGLQYFFNINLTARLDNLFSKEPSIDLTVDQPSPPIQEVAPVPDGFVIFIG